MMKLIEFVNNAIKTVCSVLEYYLINVRNANLIFIYKKINAILRVLVTALLILNFGLAIISLVILLAKLAMVLTIIIVRLVKEVSIYSIANA